MFIPVPFIYGSSYQKSPEELKADAEFRAFKQQIKNDKFKKEQRKKFCDFIRTKGFVPILRCNYGVRFISTKYPNLWGEYNNNDIMFNWWAQGVSCSFRLPDIDRERFFDEAVASIIQKVSSSGLLGEFVKPGVLYFRLPNEKVSIDFEHSNPEDVQKVAGIAHNHPRGVFKWYTTEWKPKGRFDVCALPVEHKVIFDDMMLMLAHGFVGDLDNMDIDSYDI